MSQTINLGVIGCGMMGTSIVAGILNRTPGTANNSSKRWKVDRLFLSVSSEISVSRLRSTFWQHLHRVDIYQSDNLAVVKNSDIIILACKPTMMQSVLGSEGLGQALAGKVLISVLPGTSTEDTRNALLTSANVQVVRTMPNLAAKVGESMTVVASAVDDSGAKAVEVTRWLFDHVGATQTIPEALFDLIGSLVGCSAAMFTIAVDGLLDECVSGGLARDQGLKMVSQTLRGLAGLLEAGSHPAVLREQIASPGGTTIRSLQELERQGVRSAFASALGAAGERARELGSK